MIFDLANTAYIDRFVSKITDARGVDCGDTSIWCNTDTGEMRRAKKDSDGNRVIDWDKGEMVIETVMFTPPLRVEFRDGTVYPPEDASWRSRPPLL